MECSISPIQGTMARIIRLNSCGVPVTGAGSLLVFEGFVEVQVSPQYRDGVEYVVTNAQGDTCVDRQAPDKYRRDEVDIRFCAITPDAVVITTGQEIITTGAPASGTGFWVKEGPIEAHWGLELWQADGDEQCTGSAELVGYWAWPHLEAGRLMDFTVGDVALEWRIRARSRKANTAWGLGPGTVKYINQVPANAHRGFNISTLAPPTPTTTCGAAVL